MSASWQEGLGHKQIGVTSALLPLLVSNTHTSYSSHPMMS